MIFAPVDEVWLLTQDCALHQRWDLRFSKIDYLPRVEGEPQRFLYSTRIGFGIAIDGTGESTGTITSSTERTSALSFESASPLSLIREGSGYWKYVDGGKSTRFFTWYDYRTRWNEGGWWDVDSGSKCAGGDTYGASAEE
jgi:hypothetical protein